MVENMIEKRITVKSNPKPKFGGQTFSADKTAEISTRGRKFCPPKIFVRRKFCPPNFCPIRYDVTGAQGDKISDNLP